jgi:APA family basic amino acid/polyamine antiporter
MSAHPPREEPSLVRALGARDTTLLTVGAILGTGVFLTTSDIARLYPDPMGILALWIAGGLLTLAGALTYGELGAMFPEAGGQYHYLKESYGPLCAFLFGWCCFFVSMTGGIAVIAVGFGEYLGAFVPFFSTSHEVVSIPLPMGVWRVNGGQIAGSIAIVFLTAINCFGVRTGAGFGNVVSAIKILALVGLAGAALFAPAPQSIALALPAAPAGGLAAIGVAMIAVLWTYDGWYGATFVAGELKRPERTLPIGLIAGTAIVTLLYLLVNVAYIRAMSVEQIAASPRIAEAAATVLFGPMGGRVVSAMALVSIFGCLAVTILYCARIYLPMAQDGLFFSALAHIHPVYRTPNASLIAQGALGILLTCSGTYQQLYTYVIFAIFLFHAATGIAVFVLRRHRPEIPRPFRVPGYPWVPLLFVGTSVFFVVNTLLEAPRESLVGLGLLALGVPAYAYWRWRARAAR